MPASTGSATARGYGHHHRSLRLVVLARDRWRCQRPDPITGAPCGAPASHAGHIVDRANGGPTTLDNLRAECVACNCAAGARLGNERRARRSTPSVFSRGPRQRTPPPASPSPPR